MLATMATVTSGLMSPNSYGLNPDQVAAKMSAAPDDFDRHHYHRSSPPPPPPPVFNSANSSDSDQDADVDQSLFLHNRLAPSPKHLSTNQELPKRNKRKNFKPRCAVYEETNAASQQQQQQTTNSIANTTIITPRSAVTTPNNDLLLLNNTINDNDNNNSVGRRRKTASTRKLVIDSRYSPMDLSKTNDSDDSNCNSDSEEYNIETDNNDDNDLDNDDGGNNSENDTKMIPSSFSIHTLAKPHVNDFGGGGGGGGQFHQGQISDMREYAMNTMRELLGIYGLTSEVAESISRSLPIAAFATGKIFENFTLNPAATTATTTINTNSPTRNNNNSGKLDSSPLSQPPTPPSTPLSPRSNLLLPNIPSVIHNNSSLNIPQNFSGSNGGGGGGGAQKTPLNLVGGSGGGSGTKTKSIYANGSTIQDFPYSNVELEAIRNKIAEDRAAEQKAASQQGSRGIFPANILPFSQLKTEPSSPPPFDPSPLNAMMAQSLQPTPVRDSVATPSLLLNKPTNQLDYSKYVKKFSSSMECGSSYCKDLNYREHFHCLDCNSRVFVKKEEMIRHFKWHKKRDESLQHGFMRYSPLDDCSDRFSNCTHNKKQTHYHCIKEGCDKVYISTSDVQMHANYHRKDSAIIQEGFQRYRATEECGASYCAFFGQRTTHFHCRRPGCKFTFKNKSDMEKHKSYHIKDEQLSRDGFKKFMKNEVCPFDKCRFSKVCNHIHCIRPQCSYVLHSSGQLFSHKRKHERKDSELAYRKYKLAQSMMKTIQDGSGSSGGSGAISIAPNLQFNSSNRSNTSNDYEHLEGLNLSIFNQNSSTSNMSNTESLSEQNSPLSYGDCESAMDLTAADSNFLQDDLTNWNTEDFWRKYCQFVSQQDCCSEKCEFNYTDHYHCTLENCEMVFNSKDGAREHARNHEQQEIVTDNYYTTILNGSGCDDSSCIYQDKDKHYHCNWDNCREVIVSTDKPFRRLEHYKMHEYSRKLSLTKDPLTMTHLATSIDGMFCRKRGRPPKNRVIEVWNDYNPLGGQGLMDSPQAIFTSFKLPKPSTTPSSSKEIEQQDSSDDRSSTHSPNIQDYSLQGFEIFKENTKCPDNLCPYLGSTHFHCNQNRCLYVTDKEDVLIMHSKDFHDNIEILDGFEFYDRNVDCRLPDCGSNKINRHFHCTRSNCNYSFVQYSTMAIHNQKHAIDEELNNSTPTPEIKLEIDEKNEQTLNNEVFSTTQKAMNLSQNLDNKVVKASGTFFPLSTLPTERKSPEISKNLSTECGTPDVGNTGSSTLYGPELSCSRPFCKLKRKYHYHCNACNQAFSEMDRLVVHVAKHSTGALSSQLQEDNNNQQPIQQQQQQQPHTVKNEPKISVAPLQNLQNPPNSKSVDTSAETATAQPNNMYLTPPTFDAYNHFTNFPANLQFTLMSPQQFNSILPQSLYQNAGISAQLMFQHSQLMQNPLLSATQHTAYPSDNLTSPLAAMAANLNKRSLSPHHDITPDQKKARIQNSMRILKDEPVPDGYLRFRFNEDCQYQHCGYREHQTHFHCQRQDCGYSFCDKTRFVQHTARHERLDTLMGGDFQQYRANVACGRPDCAYTSNLGSTQNKASHFHCLKCDFVCTDTNKVVAHRRQHQKLDSIQAAGFEKFTPSQHCRIQNCQHSGKQTHYHCLSCQYAVLGLAQMSAHKYRHMEG